MNELWNLRNVFLWLFFQDLLQKSNATDASGNVILSDFGVHMQQKVSSSETPYAYIKSQYKGWLWSGPQTEVAPRARDSCKSDSENVPH